MSATRWTKHAAVMSLGMLLAGCGDATQPLDGDGLGIGGFDDTFGMPKLDAGAGAGDATSGSHECVELEQSAEPVIRPVDIIFVIDNSSSMAFEAEQIQARLNDFSSEIIDSGIDVHVVLISSHPELGSGICIEPPLGSGGCPSTDDNQPVFTHVDQLVQSRDSWEVLLATHGQWDGALREDSVKHVVVVTDDVSDMPWYLFRHQFEGLDPSYTTTQYHSVVCHFYCPTAAGVGSDYIALSSITGSMLADLCDQDFQAVFDVLSTAVISGATLSCELALPDPPDDMVLDFDRVNVELDDGTGASWAVGRVGLPTDCANVVDGWHYDDPVLPTTIVLCPQTCAKIQVENGSVDIHLGCATIPAG